MLDLFVIGMGWSHCSTVARSIPVERFSLLTLCVAVGFWSVKAVNVVAVSNVVERGNPMNNEWEMQSVFPGRTHDSPGGG